MGEIFTQGVVVVVVFTKIGSGVHFKQNFKIVIIYSFYTLLGAESPHIRT